MTSPQLSQKENYEVEIEILGRGSFGDVQKIKIKENKKTYALKRIKLKNNLSEKEEAEELEEAKKEYNILKKGISHVVGGVGSFYNNQSKIFSFSMEFFPCNLFEYVKQNKMARNISHEDFFSIFKDILTG